LFELGFFGSRDKRHGNNDVGTREFLTKVIDKFGVLPYSSGAIIEDEDVGLSNGNILIDNDFQGGELEAELVGNCLTIMEGVGVDGNR